MHILLVGFLYDTVFKNIIEELKQEILAAVIIVNEKIN
jgi:hypothetical protein